MNDEPLAVEQFDPRKIFHHVGAGGMAKHSRVWEPSMARQTERSRCYAHTGLPSEQFRHISMLLRAVSSVRRNSV